ncbi:MAG: helix-turn-helix transcriptional regulator [Opitutaceae bacterium]|nr:helix-turn-helix transcriptional regulator [Opitutaceae bacterium]
MKPRPPVPDTTSAEAWDDYNIGKRIAVGSGPAWREVRLSVFELPQVAETFTMPAVTEPFIAWAASGNAEFQEREGNGPWKTTRVRKGTLFVTAAGAPYDMRWRSLGSEPFEAVLVILSMPLFNAALAEVFGAQAAGARVRDVSGFEDPRLTALLQQLRDEVGHRDASPLFVRGLGQAVGVHLARHYTEVSEDAKHAVAALPAFKLRRITDWMAENLAEEFSLARLAGQAGMSEFHFNRLFKRATGVPPSQYQIRLRMDAARRLLRETDLSVIRIGNDVGYSNPSHFARIFRKETGLTPSDYRRQK